MAKKAKELKEMTLEELQELFKNVDKKLLAQALTNALTESIDSVSECDEQGKAEVMNKTVGKLKDWDHDIHQDSNGCVAVLKHYRGTDFRVKVHSYYWSPEGIALPAAIDMTAQKDGIALFQGCKTMQSIEFDEVRLWLGTSCNRMDYMFQGCSNLMKVSGLENIDAMRITSMKSMFDGCAYLEELHGITAWETQNVTNMSYMFGGCMNLKHVDLSGFRFDNCRNIEGMLSGCPMLEDIGIDYDLTNVTATSRHEAVKLALVNALKS